MSYPQWEGEDNILMPGGGGERWTYRSVRQSTIIDKWALGFELCTCISLVTALKCVCCYQFFYLYGKDVYPSLLDYYFHNYLCVSSVFKSININSTNDKRKLRFLKHLYFGCVMQFSLHQGEWMAESVTTSLLMICRPQQRLTTAVCNLNSYLYTVAYHISILLWKPWE